MFLSIDIGIDPVIFSDWGIEITWHGLFTALGVIIGVAVATAFARREGYQEDTIYNVALCLVIGGIIGARGLYVIEHWSNFKDDLVDIVRVGPVHARQRRVIVLRVRHDETAPRAANDRQVPGSRA